MKFRHRDRGRWRRALVAWAVLTAAVLLAPGPVVEASRPWLLLEFPPLVDSVFHGVLVFVLAVLAYGSSRRPADGPRLAAALAGAAAYGLALEALQLLVPGRHLQLVDVLLTLAGIGTAGAWLAAAVARAEKAV